MDAESGLYYNRARYYDPKLGRFISEDPIGLAGGVNPYAYAGNDPVNSRDPSGLAPCSQSELESGWQELITADGPVCFFTGAANLTEVRTTASNSQGWWGSNYVANANFLNLNARGGTLAGASGWGSGGDGAAQEARLPGSCSVRALADGATKGAAGGALIGTLYGAGIGMYMGYTGGTVVGGVAGFAIAAPWGPVAVVSAVGGGVAGGALGAVAMGWVGAHAGFYSGALFGAATAIATTLALCDLGM